MAKIYPHPDFPSLKIIEAESSADKPLAGAFFVTHQNVVLSQIANRAYGTPVPPATMLTITKRINRSQYNMQKCIYRYRSDSCSSAVVPGINALNTNSWGAGAWLSLCNVDRAGVDGLGAELGTKYQVLWVPPATGQEPWDLEAPKTKPETPKVPTVPPIGVVLTPPSTPNLPGIDLDLNIKVEDGDEPEEPGQPEPELEPEPLQKAGGSWILAAILGGGALVTVLVYAYKNRKKKGGN